LMKGEATVSCQLSVARLIALTMTTDY